MRSYASLPLLALALASAPARAHVAASPDVNNRYLKATLLPGEVRLSFTLFVGDRPAAAERQRLDRNGDGTIDATEAAGFGERLLGELAPRLSVTLDGEAVTGWRVADVGLGQPSVRGGALSVDLALVARSPRPEAAEHTLVLDDETSVSDPGESETRVEESPGVRVTSCALAGATGLELRFPFAGNAAAPGERAVTARYTVDEALRAPAPSARPAWVVSCLFAAGLLLGGFLARRAARRRPAT